MIIDQISDIDFLEREVGDREQFLYVYGTKSGLLRSVVKAHVEAFARRVGWEPTSVPAGASLRAQLNAPSLFGEAFVICDATDFRLDDLQGSLADIVHGRYLNHVLLMVPRGNELLDKEAWVRAKDAFGLIAEQPVEVSNYRSVTRFLLRRSDLVDVQDFGADDRFMGSVKAFVQDSRGTSLRSLAMELERIILTETENGVVVQEARRSSRLERLVLSEALNQFLDERCTGTLHSLMQLVDRSFRAGEGAKELLGRFYRASAGIVMGRDQRYKRNREGNPAVLPYLVWGILLLEAEVGLLESNFMVAFERLCQVCHGAAAQAEAWLVDEANWQAVLLGAWAAPAEHEGSLGRARSELTAALRQRSRALATLLNMDVAVSARPSGLAEVDAVPAGTWV